MSHPRLTITETPATELEPAAVYVTLTDNSGAEIDLSREPYERNRDKDEAIRIALRMADIELASIMQRPVLLPDGVQISRGRVHFYNPPE